MADEMLQMKVVSSARSLDEKVECDGSVNIPLNLATAQSTTQDKYECELMFPRKSLSFCYSPVFLASSCPLDPLTG